MDTTEGPAKANMTYAVGSFDCTTGTELTSPTGIRIVAPPKLQTEPPTHSVDDTEDNPEKATRKRRKVADLSVKGNDILVEPPEDAHKYILRVPILVNHKALKKDDVLLVFLKDDKQGEKRAQSCCQGGVRAEKLL